MNAQLKKSELAAIRAEVYAKIGDKPTADTIATKDAGNLKSVLDWITGAGRVVTLLTAETVQALAALIIAIVFAVLEFQRVQHGAEALGQEEGQAALIAFAVVTANVVHPIYALRELRGQPHLTITVGTLRGSIRAFWRRINGEPVVKEVDSFHNPTLHVAAAVITWATVLLAVYDILGPLMEELFSPDGLQRPAPIAVVELLAGLGLSIAGVFFLQSAAHEIGVRTITDAPISDGVLLQRAQDEYQRRFDETWAAVESRYLESKDKAAAAAPVPFGSQAPTPDGPKSTLTSEHVNGNGGQKKAQLLDAIKAT